MIKLIGLTVFCGEKMWKIVKTSLPEVSIDIVFNNLSFLSTIWNIWKFCYINGQQSVQFWLNWNRFEMSAKLCFNNFFYRNMFLIFLIHSSNSYNDPIKITWFLRQTSIWDRWGKYTCGSIVLEHLQIGIAIPWKYATCKTADGTISKLENGCK